MTNDIFIKKSVKNLQKDNPYSDKNLDLKSRIKIGKNLRYQFPIDSLSYFDVVGSRETNLLILEKQEEDRILEYLPIRHQRMMEEEFAYYRGCAAVMAYDLAKVPTVDILVQLCGDMHVANFGFFSTTEKNLVFGINDFDETSPGNFDWDLKRLVASIVIASKVLGGSKKFQAKMVKDVLESYIYYIKKYSKMPFIKLARKYIDAKSIKNSHFKINKYANKFIKAHMKNAKKSTNEQSQEKFTHLVDGKRVFVERPPLIQHLLKTRGGNNVSIATQVGLDSYVESLASDRKHLLKKYSLKDAVRKVVGVGSVGCPCWVMYFEGFDDNDPLFLQAKVPTNSVLAPYFPEHEIKDHGERVVSGQRLIQGAPDIFLGYGHNVEKPFYVRQLRDMKGGIKFGNDENSVGLKELPSYAMLFGWALANAHARSGDSAVIRGYIGKGDSFIKSLTKFAFKYSKQNEIDYKKFLEAIADGKLKV